jgi:hypothetical protein
LQLEFTTTRVNAKQTEQVRTSRERTEKNNVGEQQQHACMCVAVVFTHPTLKHRSFGTSDIQTFVNLWPNAANVILKLRAKQT